MWRENEHVVDAVISEPPPEVQQYGRHVSAVHSSAAVHAAQQHAAVVAQQQQQHHVNTANYLGPSLPPGAGGYAIGLAAAPSPGVPNQPHTVGYV